MTWTTQPYCSRADVLVTLDPQMGSADNDFIDSLILQAQEDIDTELGYSFQQDGTSMSPASRQYSGTGEEWLWIDPLISPYATGTPPTGTVLETTFTQYLSPAGFWVSGAATTTDISADIILKPDNYASSAPYYAWKLTRKSGLPFMAGPQNYQVFGVWGQPVRSGQIYPGVPNDIMRACIRLVIHYYKQRDTAYADLVTEQGGIRERYNADWPTDVMRTIVRRQHHRFLTR